MDKRRYIFLAAAVAFIVVGYLASRTGDEGDKKAAVEIPEVTFPREQVKKRFKKKRPGQRASAPLATKRSPRDFRAGPHDAVEAAVGGAEGGGVVVEFNAIRNTPLAEKILRCREAEAMKTFGKFEEKLGIDLERDVDRIAFGGRTFVASGYFDKLRVPEEMGEGEAFGEGATIYHAPSEDGAGVHIARLDNDMVMMSPDREELEASIARARGDVETEPMRYSGDGGELYGHVTPAFLAKMLESVSPGAAAQLSGLVDDGLIRTSIDEHVALSVDLTAADETQAKDLSKTLGGAIALARAKAKEQGRDDVAELLTKARVRSKKDGRFEVDAAFPGPMVLEALGCDAEGNRIAPDVVKPIPSVPRPAKDPDAPPTAVEKADSEYESAFEDEE